MKLSQTQQEELWGEGGPYSQVRIVIETRILDDRVSREFVEVEADINPLTFKTIEQNRKRFKDDMAIQQLLQYADYRGQDFGYVVSAFSREYTDKNVMQEARAAAETAKTTLIKMHRFVMELLEIDADEEKTYNV
jgi:hypothetical protein